MYENFQFSLGSASEELRELARRPFETDEYRNAVVASNAAIIRQLEQIAANTGQVARDDDDVNLVGDDSPTIGGGGSTGGSSPRTDDGLYPDYFTTGEGGRDVFDEQWDVIPFGLQASQFDLRYSADVVIAFKDPEEYDNAAIPLFGSGGWSGDISTDRVWIKQGPGAETTPTVFITAL